MKIKCLILILITFLMCGCTASVNLEITDSEVKENVEITFYQNAIYPKDVIKTSFRNYIPIYESDSIIDAEPDLPSLDIIYYEKEETDLGNGYRFNYKYDFDILDYNNARTIKEGFRSYNVSKENDIISLSTDDEGILCFDDYPLLEEVRVNIKTDYFVLENNADSINGNTYTWVFNKDSKKSINMSIDTTRDANYSVIDGLIPIVIIVAIILIIVLFLVFRNKNNNKI